MPNRFKKKKSSVQPPSENNKFERELHMDFISDNSVSAVLDEKPPVSLPPL